MVNNCILVVDDEIRMRKLIKDFLVAKGYSILEAEDGEKALEVFEENKNKIRLYGIVVTPQYLFQRTAL